MTYLAHIVLIIIHVLYAIKKILSSLVPLRSPRPLLAQRQKLPKHVALLLVPDAENYDTREESVMEECVEQVVEWCKEVGIQRLSVYERDGVLSRKSIHASPPLSHGLLNISENTVLKPPRGPLTPPPSDTDSSRPRSPDFDSPIPYPAVTTFQLPYLSRDDSGEDEMKLHRRRRQSHIFEHKSRLRTLTLQFLSREASKPAIAAAARSLAVVHIPPASRTSPSSFSVTIDVIKDLLEGASGFPPPDLVIVHSLHPSNKPLELHGFPPWQIRLSEIYYPPCRRRLLLQVLRYLSPSQRYSTKPTALAISELDFRSALDEYSAAQIRLGK